MAELQRETALGPVMVSLSSVMDGRKVEGRSQSVNWGGGGGYSYIRVLPDEFLLKSVVITVDFKRNSSRRARIYEYANPPPPPQLTL